MKNVTLTLPEEVAKWARIWAAEHGTSVSRMLGDLLVKQMDAELGYREAMHDFLGRQSARKLKKSNQHYPRREDLYDRYVR